MKKPANKILASFFFNLKDFRTFSDYTVESYYLDIKQFFVIVLGININERELIDFSAFNESLIKKYLYILNKGEMSKVTILRKLSSLRKLNAYLLDQKVISKSALEDIKLKNKEKKLPLFLSQEDTGILLSSPEELYKSCEKKDEKKEFIMYRDRAILEVLYSGGLRISELLQLKWIDIAWEEESFIVSGKGKKQRVCFLGNFAKNILQEYRNFLIRSKIKLAKGGEIFLNFKGDKLSSRTVQRRFKVYTQFCGFSQDLTPHSLRHCFATHLLNNGADIRYVQEMLGHEELSSTQIYTHISHEKISEVYRQSHPHA